MSDAEKRMVAGYAALLNGLSKEAKQELINTLSQSLEKDVKTEKEMSASFSGFIPEKTAEEIIEDLRNSRHFQEKDLTF